MPANLTFSRWGFWWVEGPPDKLAMLLAELDGSLPPGWQKLAEEEVWKLPILLGKDSFRAAYLWSPPAGDAVRITIGVTVESWGGRDLRGARVVGIATDSAGKRRVVQPGFDPFDGRPVDVLIDEGLLPAAERVGLRVHRVTIREILLDKLSIDTREALLAFDAKFDAGGRPRVLPMEWAEMEAWNEFVATAFRSGARPDSGLLTVWFRYAGWSDEDADRLVDRFFAECHLLDHYRDTLVIV